jgi:hypothetical protein
MNRPTRELVAAVIGILAAVIVFRLALETESVLIWQAGLFDWTYGLAIATASAVVATFTLAYVLARRRLSLPPIGYIAAAVFLVPYLITWTVGIPRVLTDFTSTEVAKYKQLKAENNRVWEAHPVIRFFVAFPVAPALVLTYHEYQLAGLYGAGTWELTLWYGYASRSLWQSSLWVS